MTPFFSIVIPVYNVAPYLRECLDSVMAQTFADWEAICVDDGSTDGSGAILDEFAARDKRFRVIHQKNAGVSAARNMALEVAGGEWFLFLDGDDAFRVDALRMFFTYVRDGEVDGILVSPYTTGWDGKGIPDRKVDSRVLIENASRYELCLGQYAANGYPFSRCYRTKIFANLRFRTDMSMAEDVCFWFDALCLSARWMIVQEDYYLYRNRNDSVSREGNPHRCVQILESVRYALHTIGEWGEASSLWKNKYIRRFPWSPMYYLNVASERQRELSNHEWEEILSKFDAIRNECGCWPFGLCERIQVCLARWNSVRCLLPCTVRLSKCYYWFRIKVGGLRRRHVVWRCGK